MTREPVPGAAVELLGLLFRDGELEPGVPIVVELDGEVLKPGVVPIVAPPGMAPLVAVDDGLGVGEGVVGIVVVLVVRPVEVVVPLATPLVVEAPPVLVELVPVDAVLPLLAPYNPFVVASVLTIALVGISRGPVRSRRNTLCSCVCDPCEAQLANSPEMQRSEKETFMS